MPAAPTRYTAIPNTEKHFIYFYILYLSNGRSADVGLGQFGANCSKLDRNIFSYTLDNGEHFISFAALILIN